MMFVAPFVEHSVTCTMSGCSTTELYPSREINPMTHCPVRRCSTIWLCPREINPMTHLILYHTAIFIKRGCSTTELYPPREIDPTTHCTMSGFSTTEPYPSREIDPMYEWLLYHKAISIKRDWSMVEHPLMVEWLIGSISLDGYSSMVKHTLRVQWVIGSISPDIVLW